MSKIRTERDGRVLTATISNPPYNFLTGEIMKELHELLLEINGDRSIGTVVLASDLDGIFISHFDVRELAVAPDVPMDQGVPHAVASGTLRLQGVIEQIPGARNALSKTAAAAVSDLLHFHETCALMQRIDKVLIASINGRALGGGSELALACDIRIMAQGPFQIGQPEVLIGIIPGGGGTQRLPRAIGHGRALELLLEGRPLSPMEALDIGYVNHVVAPGDLVEFTNITAHRLSRRSNDAVAAIKRTVNGDASLAKGLRAERSAFLSTVSSKSARTAMRAYIDHIDALEAAGEDLSIESLGQWLDGTAYDFNT
ncbi:enoyl-CoA hydratase/isomerase family protein [Antrihabitans spumae]|uniref:Enoyl-CoA hydratase/isomerase family protein n=1 Tax=Antrihabitans spumae TaxID=3373370 RepID=A0ABW7K9S7_9NOCA